MPTGPTRLLSYLPGLRVASLSLSPSFTRRLPVQHLVAMANKSAGEGGAVEPCTCSSSVMGMLRVDHEEGLWSAAKDDHGAWTMGPEQKMAG